MSLYPIFFGLKKDQVQIIKDIDKLGQQLQKQSKEDVRYRILRAQLKATIGKIEELDPQDVFDLYGI